MLNAKEKKEKIYSTEMLFEENQDPAVTTTDSENDEKK